MSLLIDQTQARDSAVVSLKNCIGVAKRAAGLEARRMAAYDLVDALEEAQLYAESDEIYDLMGDFDFHEFVFRYTHFDSCSGFRFFRRTS